LPSLLDKIREGTETFHVKLKLSNINADYSSQMITVEEKIQKGERNIHRKVTKQVRTFQRSDGHVLIHLRVYIVDVLCRVAKASGMTERGSRFYGVGPWIRNGGVRVIPYDVTVPSEKVKVEINALEPLNKITYENVPKCVTEADISIISRGCFDLELVKALFKRGENVGFGPRKQGRYEILG